MEPTNTTQDASKRMRVGINVCPVEGSSVTMMIAETMDREAVEQEIRDGMLQGSFMELLVETEDMDATLFINARHVLSISVAEFLA